VARIRAIKPEFWLDEEIASWPHVTRLAYIGLWNEADDEGRMRANLAYLKNRIFPYEPRLDIETVLGPVIATGKLVIYRVGGQTFGFLPNFTDHQVINRPSASKLPAPHEASVSEQEDSLKTHGGLSEDSVRTHAGKERKGKERNGRRAFAPPNEEEWLSYVTETYPDWPKPDALSAHGWYETKAWQGVRDWHGCAKTCYYRWAGKPAPRSAPSAQRALVGSHSAAPRDIEDAPEEIRAIARRISAREDVPDEDGARLGRWMRGE
jgi:hypothetical protein